MSSTHQLVWTFGDKLWMSWWKPRHCGSFDLRAELKSGEAEEMGPLWVCCWSRFVLEQTWKCHCKWKDWDKSVNKNIDIKLYVVSALKGKWTAGWKWFHPGIEEIRSKSIKTQAGQRAVALLAIFLYNIKTNTREIVKSLSGQLLTATLKFCNWFFVLLCSGTE